VLRDWHCDYAWVLVSGQQHYVRRLLPYGTNGDDDMRVVSGSTKHVASL
jgi:hypothetical protein